MKKYLTSLITDKIFYISVFCLTAVSLITVIYINSTSKPSESTLEATKSVNKENIVKDSLQIEINSQVPKPTDYFEDSPKENLNINYYQNEKEVEVKTDKVATYDVIISGNINYRSKLEIVDTTPPEVELKTITIYENNKYLANDFVSSYQDNSGDLSYTVYFINAEQANLTKTGTYEITLKVCDVNNVCTEKNTVLKINTKSKNDSKQKEQKPTKVESPTKKENKVVDKITKNVTIKSKDIKYGVKEVTTAKITYNVYSDGTQKEIDRQDIRTKYDFSGFNGTINSMKQEANNLYNNLSSTRDTIVTETNKYRSEQGLTGLRVDKTLSILATVRAMEMAYGNKFSHTRPNGKSWDTFWNESGFNFSVPAGGTYGENLAYGYTSDLGACNGWRNSEGHYANMINPAYTKIGIGKYTLNGKTYWVQFFSS